ncbi:hypothetical protein [Pseudomonas sp. NPDC090201]|uniref:hypothetical protein n=1 Tax=Pseudomonas sp. NPDC090201 TaxID=3364475 RepID=UPI0037F478AA
MFTHQFFSATVQRKGKLTASELHRGYTLVIPFDTWADAYGRSWISMDGERPGEAARRFAGPRKPAATQVLEGYWNQSYAVKGRNTSHLKTSGSFSRNTKMFPTAITHSA